MNTNVEEKVKTLKECVQEALRQGINLSDIELANKHGLNKGEHSIDNEK